MKKKEQLPIYKREFCLHKEGTRTFLPTIVQAHQPITDEDLRVTAIIGGHFTCFLKQT